MKARSIVCIIDVTLRYIHTFGQLYVISFSCYDIIVRYTIITYNAHRTFGLESPLKCFLRGLGR